MTRITKDLLTGLMPEIDEDEIDDIASYEFVELDEKSFQKEFTNHYKTPSIYAIKGIKATPNGQQYIEIHLDGDESPAFIELINYENDCTSKEYFQVKNNQ